MLGLFLVVVMGVLGLAAGIGLMITQIPSVDELLAARSLGATQVFDRTGKVLASVQNGENRELVTIDKISLDLRHAVIASEDFRFYEHWGLDMRGLMRAVYSRGTLGGGSTITQQLAKNLFLSPDRTAARKIADMWLALQLERRLTKDQILEMYLNQVYFGHGAYGVEAASRKYFGKHASAIGAAEGAMLAGLLPAPEAYSPYRSMDAAKEVQSLVIKRMTDAGYLSSDSASAALRQKLVLANTPDYAYRAPYFTSHVLAVLQERYGPDLVMRGALKIHTTLDFEMQEAAEAAIRRGVAGYQGYNVGQGALVAIQPGTGAVRALVGGTNYDKSSFNRATMAHRQPGSTFKPFVYLTAFTQGYGPSYVINDAPVSYSRYAPMNYDHRFHGLVSIERSLAWSYNVPAVKMANAVGMAKVVKLAHDVGIKSPLPEQLAVALGSAEVTPLELATAYATLGAAGNYCEAQFLVRVEDANGNLIEEFKPNPAPVVPDTAVYALNRCLLGVVQYGTGAAANIGRPAAGKTGTTSENRDIWFAGYTPDLACVVWLGNDNNSRLAASATGGGLAAPLWAKFMAKAHKGLPVRQLRSESPPTTVAPAYEAPAPAESGPTTDPNASAEPETPDPNVSLEPSPLEGSPMVEPLPSVAEPTDPPMSTPEPTAVPTAEPTAVPAVTVPAVTVPTVVVPTVESSPS